MRIKDVSQILGVESRNLSTLCNSKYVNKWSYHKPITSNKPVELLYDDYRGISGNCGLNIEYKDRIEDCIGVNNFLPEKPNIARLGDFRNYEHDAPQMWQVSLSPVMKINSLFICNLQSWEYGYNEPDKLHCVTPDKIDAIKDMYLCCKFVITNANGTRSNYRFADRPIGELEYDVLDTSIVIPDVTTDLNIKAGDAVKVYAALSPTNNTGFTYFIPVEMGDGKSAYKEYIIDNTPLYTVDYSYTISNVNYYQQQDTLFIYGLDIEFNPLTSVNAEFKVDLRSYGTEQVDENGDDIPDSNPYHGATILNHLSVTPTNNRFSLTYTDVIIKLTDNVDGEVLLQPRLTTSGVNFKNSQAYRIEINRW